MTIVGLSGYKQSGKNTVARIISDLSPGSEETAFADPLRALAKAIDPIVDFYDPNEVRGGGPMYYSEALEEYGYERAKALLPEFRRHLQRLGSDGMRDTIGGTYRLREIIGDDLWVVLMQIRLTNLEADMLNGSTPDAHIIVTDVRFPNEADLIRDMGGVMVRISRDGDLPVDPHQSETALDDYQGFDVRIHNGGSLDALKQAVELSGLI